MTGSLHTMKKQKKSARSTVMTTGTVQGFSQTNIRFFWKQQRMVLWVMIYFMQNLPRDPILLLRSVSEVRWLVLPRSRISYLYCQIIRSKSSISQKEHILRRQIGRASCRERWWRVAGEEGREE